jgi:hypothetical protein
MCADIQMLVCNDALNICCRKVAPQGGCFAEHASFNVAKITLNLFKSEFISSDFLQDLVCTCKGKSVCLNGCICLEQNLSCKDLCPCQASELCCICVDS